MALITALLMGWRPAVSFLTFIVVLLLSTLIGWSISWIFALVGLIVKNAELIGSLSMIITLVMTFLSNAFIPTRTLPSSIQVLVKINPVSLAITAIRNILKTGTWGTSATMMLISGIIIILIFMPLSVFVYQKRD